MRPVKRAVIAIGFLIFSLVFIVSCSSDLAEEKEAARQSKPRYMVVQPGTHPGLLFCAEELPVLRQRAGSGGLAGEAWQKIKELSEDWTMRGEWTRRGMQLDAMALIYQVERDRETGRAAVELFKETIAEIEPFAYYKEVDSDFFETEHWPKAFAYAWDWLYELMTEEERAQILAALENWCKALYEHTESWWWRDASYNCGAIPVGALGLLCTSIQGETGHPEFDKWFSSALRRIRDNYFPTAWRANGICYEGPCYAHYHKNSTQFGEAFRRTGGPDIITTSGAVNAMQYQRFQWMPQGGCGPIGDNTGYGRRVFQAIYLFGIGQINDGPGLWTFEKYTDRRRLNPILTFVCYPDHVQPVSPGQADCPTSHYFEITPNRAGYIYSRSEWDNEQAAWFAFVTRYANANHQHYDMNSFLFMAFGEEFATHANIYSYRHEHHGADIEHNMVIVDGGGMPANDRSGSAGDDCSLYGFMTGVGLGRFADYMRADAKLSYRDRSVRSSTPALRADRYGLFAKQGPNPYVVMVDDIQKSKNEHDYHWQWYTRAKAVNGAGTLDDPFLIEAENANCAIAFVTPLEPEYDFQIVSGGSRRYPLELGLIRVHQQGSRVRFFSVGAAWEKGSPAPKFKQGPSVTGNPDALSLVVEGENFTDLILWQPEEFPERLGAEISCGEMVTDGFLSMVRTDKNAQVIGYLLGDGRKLVHKGKILAEAEEIWSVSAGGKRVFATGRKRARQNLPPLAAQGSCWLPQPGAALFADGKQLAPPLVAPGRMALVGK